MYRLAYVGGHRSLWPLRLTAQVIFRGTRSAGYGFVSVATPEAAQKAVELLDKQELDGRQVIVEVAKPAEQKDQEKKAKKASKRRPGRRGSKSVPGEVTEAEANGEAANGDADKADGATSAAEGEKPKKKKKNSRKSKAAKKAAAEGGDAATDAAPATEGAAEGATKKPRTRKPKTVRPPRPAGEDPAGEPSKTVLFVANLGFSIDDDGLATLFTEAGVPVNSARIVRRRWGKPRKSKGYGFVDVGDEEQQKKAIELLQGKEVEGRAIAVKIAVNSQTEEGAENGETADPVANGGEAKPEREATPEVTVVAS
ncbi:uncharacterized protein B0H18DRAFT_966936 [Fomitopsis serialis]|uniref:uncharacterized protein n=1 Tax=Fomitopsis serialis TaxID=139415 RepID=UPI0020089DEB|nr:uncharacterized protein B0H18DRAFT_966936 [Neoantrodia serialis]KAH9938397.1 hypothetical protein B0H18DRAFT_966936 [Neoantrodia serialis]